MASSNFFELLEIKKPPFDTFIYVIYRFPQAVSKNASPLWGKEESRRLAGRLPMLWGVENGHFSGAQNPVNLFIFFIEVLVF